jgi:hypothetical protein
VSFQFARRAAACHLPQDEVASEKRVWIAQRSHGDVLRRPRANPRQRLQGARHHFVSRPVRQHDLAGHDGPRERANGLGP